MRAHFPHHWKRIAAVMLAAAGLPFAVSAADAFYLGAWRIASAVVAPWADPAARKPDDAEMKSLVGKTVVMKSNEIAGPRIMGCKGPKYKVKDYPPDFLFQGAFGEMHDRDKSVDPVKVAAKLGFKGPTSKALETGCGNELDFHFVDPATAQFGLNDYVYTMKKE